ncbi:MAG: acyl-CoA thioesterase [Vulcanimicrobiota bacterium]
MDFHFELNSRVELRDLDALGHVYHVNYLVFFENVRTAFWFDLTGHQGLEALDFVMATVTCNYHAPVYMGEQVCSRLRIEKVGNKSLTLAYEVYSSSQGRVVADGISVQVAYDYSSRQSKAMAPELKERLLNYSRPRARK